MARIPARDRPTTRSGTSTTRPPPASASSTRPSTPTEPDRTAWLTQYARALGLQEKYDEATRVLDGLASDDPEAATYLALERGRVLRSSGRPDDARPHFEAAAASAEAGGLEALHVDALHMVALVAPAEEQLALNERGARGRPRVHGPAGPRLGRRPCSTTSG